MRPCRNGSARRLTDGQSILELGCGWGSLTLWMAERFPGTEIVAVSNSHKQRSFILAEAARRGLRAPTVVAADINAFSTGDRSDCIVSVEMFEHMSNWSAQHIFTGGVMPSHGLIRHLQVPFAVEEEWRWGGDHYRRTAEHWLANYDAHAEPLCAVLRRAYGDAATLWMRRWRLFFLATAELFGAAHGNACGISHYRLRPQ